MPSAAYTDSPVNVEGFLPYLDRDEVYSKEKPFGADFPVDHFKGSRLANHTFEKFPLTIYDIRGAKGLTVNLNGFCFLKSKIPLAAEEVSNDRTPAMDNFLVEVERALYHSFPEYSRIEVMDFQVRKRDPGFPEKVGIKVEYEQPAGMPHTDFSVNGAYMRMKEAFPGQEKYYEDKSFDLLNVWRVLEGPNDDWPLAVCDFQTIDLDNDVISNDCLHPMRVGENWLLHSNKAHRWYYMSKQEEEDLIVFRNTDSEGVRPRGFHTAFMNPLANCKPRQSIEVRVVAFR